MFMVISYNNAPIEIIPCETRDKANIAFEKNDDNATYKNLYAIDDRHFWNNDIHDAITEYGVLVDSSIDYSVDNVLQKLVEGKAIALIKSDDNAHWNVFNNYIKVMPDTNIIKKIKQAWNETNDYLYISQTVVSFINELSCLAIDAQDRDYYTEMDYYMLGNIAWALVDTFGVVFF